MSASGPGGVCTGGEMSASGPRGVSPPGQNS